MRGYPAGECDQLERKDLIILTVWVPYEKVGLQQLYTLTGLLPNTNTQKKLHFTFKSTLKYELSKINRNLRKASSVKDRDHNKKTRRKLIMLGAERIIKTNIKYNS